jgi:hypothetical protein
MQLGCMLRISRMIFMNEYGHQAARLRHMLEAARHMNKLHVVLHDCYGIGMKHVLGCGIRIRVFPIRFTRVTYSRAAAHRDRLGPPVRRAVLRRAPGATHGAVRSVFDNRGAVPPVSVLAGYTLRCLTISVFSENWLLSLPRNLG